MQRFVLLAAILNVKLEECAVNQFLRGTAIVIGSTLLKMIKIFSNIEPSKELLTCESDWQEKIKLSETGRVVTSLMLFMTSPIATSNGMKGDKVEHYE